MKETTDKPGGVSDKRECSGSADEFQREDRYVIFKISDLRTMMPADLTGFDQICRRVTAHRERNGKPPLQCVVVEHDWPEYEPVWQMLEKRMSAPNN